MDQDTPNPQDADAEYAAAWGDDAEQPRKPGKLAQEAAEQAQREQDEFDKAFHEGEAQ